MLCDFTCDIFYISDTSTSYVLIAYMYGERHAESLLESIDPLLYSMPTKAPSGHFSILYFASASSFTKRSSEYLRSPIHLNELFNTLEERYPGFRASVLSSCAVTINLNYVDTDEAEASGQEQASAIIHDGDEVAIIPPVSSG